MNAFLYLFLKIICKKGCMDIRGGGGGGEGLGARGNAKERDSRFKISGGRHL